MRCGIYFYVSCVVELSSEGDSTGIVECLARAHPRFKPKEFNVLTNNSKTHHAASLPPSYSRRFKGVSVLVADDSEDTRQLLKFLLSNEGAVVECAVDGKEALEKATAQKFDLILMDAAMPKVDGCQAIVQLRSLGHDEPILGNFSKYYERRCFRMQDAGCNDFISKPLCKDCSFFDN
jgi:CheY-like chemotaxis protein